MPEAPSTVSIAMQGVELIVRIGEHAWEKHPKRPTRVRLNITLTFPYAAYFGPHAGYIDYDPLHKFLIALQDREHVERLEDFGKLILATCFETTPAQRVRLSVMKPDIFHEMEAVGLEFDVTRADFAA